MADGKEPKLPAPGPEGGTELLLYQSDGQTRIDVRLVGETLWLTQNQMAELFQVDKSGISRHLDNIYETGELSREATVAKFATVQQEGARRVSRELEYYNLDAIISVGYRVNSLRGTQFRMWATQRLREYLVKGFVLDDQRLKEGRRLGADYFDELLERIRAIRASERRFYQKITDIYATSIDYAPNAEVTQQFYATVQNKLHWAIHGSTAAEIIASRADASTPNMGLTTWKNAPHGPIRKSDVTAAKNYLTQEELAALNRIITMYLDYAELQAQGRRPMHMVDWVKRLDAFLQFNERNILTHAGKLTHEMAEEHALRQFETYDAERRRHEATQPTSDFDKAVEEVKQLEKQTPDSPTPPRSATNRRPKREAK